MRTHRVPSESIMEEPCLKEQLLTGAKLRPLTFSPYVQSGAENHPALFGGFSGNVLALEGNVLESRGNAFIAINDAFGLKKQCI